MIQLKTIQTIHTAFCASIFLFSVVTAVTIKDVAYFDVAFKSTEPLSFVAPIVAFFGLIMGPFMFNKALESTTDEKTEPSARFMKYQVAFLIKCAFLEAGALINIVACLITHNLFCMVFVAICFISLFLSRPTKDRVHTTLGIQDTDVF